MRSVEIPSSWTSLSKADNTELPSSWAEHIPPSELTYLCDRVNPPAKLLEILQWSLERPTFDEQHGNETAEHPVVTEQCADDRSDSIPASIPCPQYSDDAITSRLRSIGSKNDLVSVALCKIAALKAPRAAKRPALSEHAPAAAPLTDECTSCFDDIPTRDLVRLSCSHYYCKPCLASLVLTAIQNENSYPPKCCLTEIPTATIIIPLDQKQRDLYKSKAAEYSIAADKRWYCPSPSCSKWIAPAKLRSSQKCPHCRTKICLHCRGLAHSRTSDCPQDQGLEAAINVAEANGWRRCHRCRTMVERTFGCRHITCNCGAEFCYVCGAKWKTCSCTEVDEARRQNALQRQRVAAAAREREEDEELRQALAIVSAIEAREAEERQRRQREEEFGFPTAFHLEWQHLPPAPARTKITDPLLQEAARQREEEQLARLEQERLQEEELHRQKAEALERELREALELSVHLEAQGLLDALIDAIQGQYTKLDDRQGEQEQAIVSAIEAAEREHREKHGNLSKKMAASLEQKLESINSAHDEAMQSLLAEQEQQEDEMFLQIQLHLRGKPNREAREQRLTNELRKQQESEKSKLEETLERDLGVARKSAEREAELLKRAADLKLSRAQSDYERKMAQLVTEVRVERHWFDVVSRRRSKMVHEHIRLIREELQQGLEPVGLLQNLAKVVQPLPESSGPVSTADSEAVGSEEQPTSWFSADESVQQTPVELEAPWHTPSTERNRSPPASLSSYTTTSNYSFVSVQQPEERGISPATNASTVDVDLPEALPIHSPGRDSPSRHQTTPSLNGVPQNGPAFVAAKAGESSKRLDINELVVAAPPTPPESPLPRPTVAPRRKFLAGATYHSMYTPPPSTETPVPTVTVKRTAETAPHAWSFYGPLPPGKAKSKAKEKAKAPSVASVESRPSATSAEEATMAMPATLTKAKKASRWPFRRKEELTPEEIRERMGKLRVGDAF